tara:strand:+ start:787 stop:981 length:195 start_codon:yes stop_codon:yes gene_type:complete
MENKQQILLDVIEYADGSAELVYNYDLNSDEVFMREATPSDQKFITRQKQLDAMPDEEFVYGLF